tara:strand:- start:14 stop:610 length:597 start_codon:yes stop_codon:yes gene_type:complete
MINLEKIGKDEPYLKFKNYYDEATKFQQKNIDAIAISSYDLKKNEVNCRFVNLKYIIDEDWIFFSNYNSNKAKNFTNHEQISAVFYWNSIDVQIRIKANIKKTSNEFSDEHFNKRDFKKNALAISSDQSKIIDSYDDVVSNYKKVIELDKNIERPEHWGGYLFKPYFIEFWEGHHSRINKRIVFEKTNKEWNSFFLQP